MKLYKTLFKGIEGYVVDTRIPQPDRRLDLHYYDLRHGDEDWSEPCTIEPSVFVNHWGTIAFKTPIEHLMTEWAPGRFEIQLTDDEANQLMVDSYSGEQIEMEEI